MNWSEIPVEDVKLWDHLCYSKDDPSDLVFMVTGMRIPEGYELGDVVLSTEYADGSKSTLLCSAESKFWRLGNMGDLERQARELNNEIQRKEIE